MTNQSVSGQTRGMAVVSVILWGMIVISPIDAYAAIQPTERQALLDLYDSTGGENWTNNTNWAGPEGSECGWYGVTCDQDQTTVVDLALRENNLTGYLPPTLTNLNNLWCINLGSNSLGGSIPAGYGEFTRLHCLIFDNNNLGGEIPGELGQLAALVSMNVEKNQLTGTIPAELGGLSSLTSLWLSNNQLTGVIPQELGSLASIQVLSLSTNNLSGPIPDSFASLLSLRELWLDNNALSGPIPDFLGNFSALEELWLSNNEFSGTVPSSLGNLVNLRELWLEGNHLEGVLDPALGSLVNLQHLSLARNKFSGPLPQSLLAWPQTLSADLRYNALTSESPDLDVFLQQIQVAGDWKSSQTSAPHDFRITGSGLNWVSLAWTPSGLQDVEGGYEIYDSQATDGPWSLAHTVWTKAETGFTIYGLSEGTAYFFKVRAYTNPNVDNENRVDSEYTPVIQASTKSGSSSGGGGGCFIEALSRPHGEDKP